MSTLAELTVQLMTARLSKRDLSFEELKQEMDYFATKLKNIDAGITNIQEPNAQETIAPVALEEPTTPIKINMKKTFGDDAVVCLECNNKFKTLNKHLALSHNMTDKEYKLKYNIPAKQKLCSNNISANARKSALEKDLAGKMKAKKDAKKAEAAQVTEAPATPTEG